MLVLVFLSAFNLKAQETVYETDKVYLVLLKVEKAADIARCYTMEFDQQKVEIPFAIEDTINSLPDFIYEEDPLVGPGLLCAGYENDLQTPYLCDQSVL